MNYIRVGPIAVRISRKNLAKWGWPVIELGGLRLFSRNSNGELGLAAYHPRDSLTWHWAISIGRRPPEARKWLALAPREFRRGQWRDYIGLPFGRQIIISRQDYHHREPRP